MKHENEYYCPNCNANLNEQPGFDPNVGSWTCTECGTTLYDEEFEDTMNEYPGVAWYCDSCGAFLNKQEGFDDSCGSWKCKKCGHINPINEDEIYESEEDYQNSKILHCPNCNATLNDQYDFDPDNSTWKCTQCGTYLYGADLQESIDDYPGEVYYCDSCGEPLNIQSGFYDYYSSWICTKCGCLNLIDRDENKDSNNEDDSEEEEYIESEPSYPSLNKEEYDESSYDSNREDGTYSESIPENVTPRKKLPLKIKLRIYLILFLIFAVIFGYYEIKKLISVNHSAESLIGESYEDVVKQLDEAGFSWIMTNEIKDLDITEISNDYLVTDVKIGWSDSFKENSKLPSNFPIEITYHSLKTISAPMTSKEAKSKNYTEVKKAFTDAGFVNVTTSIKYDIITGWLKDDGEVESVTINNDKKFDTFDEFRLDSNIVITYHTYLKNKS